MRLRKAIASDWISPDPPRAVDWIPQHVVIPDQTETPGHFDLDQFPHVRGVLEAIDDPDVRRIILLWSARNAKTTTSLSALVYWAATRPRPALFARENEEKADETIETLLIPMLRACPETRGELLPRQNRRSVQLRRCRIRRAYSGSPSTFAGFPACYGVASEVSKWSGGGTEADPIYLFAQRGQLYPFESKYIYEGTPGLKGHCRITRLFQAKTTQRRRRLVPCPHCGLFQELFFGDPDPESPGIKWDKSRSGHSESDRAEETAWYRCENGCRIENADRPGMMRQGIWLPEGRKINRRGRVTGKPVVGPTQVGLGRLSLLHSLVISGWGQIAREFLDAKNDREALRNFRNSTLAVDWDPQPAVADPHEIAARLCVEIPRELVPAWAVFVTAGIDVQNHGAHFPVVLCAWGPGGRGHVVWHGDLSSETAVAEFLNTAWLMDSGESDQRIGISLALMDSGNDRDMVYQFCCTYPRVKPCKGSSTGFDQLYRVCTIEEVSGLELVHVNTHASQRWLQRLLDGETTPDDPQFLSLSADDAFDLSFLDELVNEVEIEDVDSNGYPSRRWQRRHSSRPNDLRDALRYAWTAAQLLTSQGSAWHRLPGRPIGLIGQEARETPDRQKPFVRSKTGRFVRG